MLMLSAIAFQLLSSSFLPTDTWPGGCFVLSESSIFAAVHDHVQEVNFSLSLFCIILELGFSLICFCNLPGLILVVGMQYGRSSLTCLMTSLQMVLGSKPSCVHSKCHPSDSKAKV